MTTAWLPSKAVLDASAVRMSVSLEDVVDAEIARIRQVRRGRAQRFELRFELAEGLFPFGPDILTLGVGFDPPALYRDELLDQRARIDPGGKPG